MIDQCPACELYVMSRGSVIRAEIARTTPPRDRAARWRTFMAGVHDRHQAIAAGRALSRFAALMALTTTEDGES